MSDMSSDKVSQIDKLASYIMEEIEGEPSCSEGAGDCAIRILKVLKSDNAALRQRVKELLDQNAALMERVEELRIFYETERAGRQLEALRVKELEGELDERLSEIAQTHREAIEFQSAYKQELADSRAERDRLREKWQDILNQAIKDCEQYRGGYTRDGDTKRLDAFQHGMKTALDVVAKLCGWEPPPIIPPIPLAALEPPKPDEDKRG